MSALVHAFAIDALVIVALYSNDAPRPARIARHEPYRGRPGYYVRFLDATEQWHCHGGWCAEISVRPAIDA